MLPKQKQPRHKIKKAETFPAEWKVEDIKEWYFKNDLSYRKQFKALRSSLK